jgi:hypothetical protein
LWPPMAPWATMMASSSPVFDWDSFSRSV